MTESEAEHICVILRRVCAACEGEQYPNVAVALTMACSGILKDWPYDKIALLNYMIKDLKSAVLIQAV